MKSSRNYMILVGFVFFEILLIIFVDQPLSEKVHVLDNQQHALIEFFRSWTDFGKSKWYLCPSALGVLTCAILVRCKSIKHGIRLELQQAGERFLFLFICGSASGIIADIIKPLLGRARPVELERDGLYGFFPFTFDARWNSMPSGHSTSAFAFAFVLIGFFPSFRIPFFLLACALGLSRIMVNAHFLSDVLAGGMVAYLTVYVLQNIKLRNGIFHIDKRIFPIDEMALRE